MTPAVGEEAGPASRPRRRRSLKLGGGAWGCQSGAGRCCHHRCCGPLHAGSWWLPALSSSAYRPGIPGRVPPYRPGAQVRPDTLRSHHAPLLDICPPRGRPLRAVSAPRLPSPPGCGPGGGGGTTVLPIPPHTHPFGRPGPHRSSTSGRGSWSPVPLLLGGLHNRCGWGRGSPPQPRPHTCPRDTLPG